MMTMINPAKFAEAYRYANLIRNAPKRRYANAYIAWLKGGAIGHEPEHVGCSYMAAQAVRLQIDAMRLYDGAVTA